MNASTLLVEVTDRGPGPEQFVDDAVVVPEVCMLVLYCSVGVVVGHSLCYSSVFYPQDATDAQGTTLQDTKEALAILRRGTI